MTSLRFTPHPTPVLGPDPAPTFRDPVTGNEVAWAAKDVFNPAAVVRGGEVHLLFRAEDARTEVKGTSRIGLAVSDDGIRFRIEPEPVLFPGEAKGGDAMSRYEWPGGVEDPRVVETEEGGYVMTYTAFDGQMARLAIATSPDLRAWKKRGLAFPGESPNRWTKSGAIVSRLEGDRVIAARVNGRYWMLYGEGDLFAATSDDLLAWTSVTYEAGANRVLHLGPTWWEHVALPGAPMPLPIAVPRRGRFDSALVEPGPFALLTDEGIVLPYNGANGEDGDRTMPAGSYGPGWLVLDPEDPTAVISRSTAPFLRPERPFETHGQVPNVCFVNGLCRWEDRWRLYYGAGDSRIGLAVEA